MDAFLDRAVGAAGRADRRDGDYDRARILPRLVPVDPGLVADPSLEARRRILQMLARALRSERRRGRAGHWTYSLDRHLGLVCAFRAERRLARPAAEVADVGPGRGRQDPGREGAADGRG